MQDKGRFLAGVSMAIGLIIAASIGSNALVRIKSQDQSITVTGSAKRRIVSDWIVWHAEVTTQAATMADAYAQVSTQVPLVVGYLEGKGISNEQIVVSAVRTWTFHARDENGMEIQDKVIGYQMSQAISISSDDVSKVTQVSREATELINQGILVGSRDPEYHYTKLSDLKIQMLGEAAKDARVRAEQIASSTGAKVGALRSARMGVMQINPAGMTEVSAEGNNDTSSLEKDVLAIVTSSFALK
ncbi:MAG: SIMPL domain-containing protein [bacterium]